MPTPTSFVPLASWREYPPEEMQRRAHEFAAELGRRRTVRQFSDRPIPGGVVEACLEAAGTAPSGAHLQPWHFVVVRDAERKRRIREAAEEAERKFYAEAPQARQRARADAGCDGLSRRGRERASAPAEATGGVCDGTVGS